MSSKDKETIDIDMFNYSVNISELEEENRLLKETVSTLRQELDRHRMPPLMVCEIQRTQKDGTAVIRVPNGNEFYVNVSGECEKLAPGDTVLAEQKNLTIIKKIDASKKFNVDQFVIIEKPKLSWKDVGGLDKQIQEVKEIIELPLKKPKLFEKIGIQPPKGVLLYGPPGTGKTLLAKAVAASTNSTFIEIVGSELVQKFIGEGAKLVKEVFDLAREKAPSVIFIDEIDALAGNRIEIGTSGEREVQRTFMQLLAEIDGFKPLGNIKIIGCTNRKDILDAAIVRPGRLDRLIHVPAPTIEGVKQIFSIHSSRMKLDKKINLERLYEKMNGFTGAEIKAVCMEAGYFAIRDNRVIINEADLISAVNKVRRAEEAEGSDYMTMFG